MTCITLFRQSCHPVIGADGKDKDINTQRDKMKYILQAILYIRSLPQMDKKDFQAEFPGANPQGEPFVKITHLHDEESLVGY